MNTIALKAKITENGTLEASLPPGLPPGEVRLLVEFPEESRISDEELVNLLKVEPLSNAEIVAELRARGPLDLGIEDGAEWVREMRAEQQKSLKW